jgi:septum formation protein
LAANVEEDALAEERPMQYLERVVDDKLAAVLRQVDSMGDVAATLVADTVVVIDDDILGKPSDSEDAVRLLRRLTGRDHVVYTRYAIGAMPVGTMQTVKRTVASRVTLRMAADSEIRRYAATGEGLDKAGAYAAQGIGSFLIERIDGSYSNVVGLPLCEVVLDLQTLGLIPDFP